MTNSSLITVFNGQISNQAVQLCNACDLHAFLEVKSNFRDWIKNRIADYGFIQDEDYIIVTERTHGRPRKEYHITLDMGKELGMVERNERGRQIRRYFIECEKRQLQNTQPNLPLVEPEKRYPAELTEHEINQLAWLLFSHKQMNDLLGDLLKPLEAIGSRYSAMVYSHHYEYKNHYNACLKCIKRMIEPFKHEQDIGWTRVNRHLNKPNF